VTAEDIAAIQQVVALYGNVIDDRKWDELGRVFTDDAVYDLSCVGAGVITGLPAIRAFFAGFEHPLGHFSTNVVIDERADGGADIMSKGITLRRDKSIGMAVYRDVAVRTDAGWRLAVRVAEIRA
jgi:hypothetical protein